MFDHRHYVPILRAKLGEYRAVKMLDQHTKEMVTPLFEVPPLPWDFDDDCPAIEIDKHISNDPQRIAEYWGTDLPFFVDLDSELYELQLHDKRLGIEYLLDELRNLSTQCIPVTGPDRPSSYQSYIRSIIDKFGVCFRLQGIQFIIIERFREAVTDLLETLNIIPDNVHLILDLGDILHANNELLLDTFNKLQGSDTYHLPWSSITFAGSAFPVDLSEFGARSVHRIERKAWITWIELLRLSSTRKPAFGDYTINNPRFTQIDPRYMRMSANLRYTAGADWVILKGRNVKDYGFDQFNGLCKQLVGTPDYKGAHFSWGDEFISECANGKAGPGNATTWRQIAVSHHIKFVIDEIANSVAP